MLGLRPRVDSCGWVLIHYARLNIEVYSEFSLLIFDSGIDSIAKSLAQNDIWNHDRLLCCLFMVLDLWSWGWS